MPRAENRKRPPNSLGNVPGSGVRNRSKGNANNSIHEAAHASKQSVLEKMKQLQNRKQAASPNEEDEQA